MDKFSSRAVYNGGHGMKQNVLIVGKSDCIAAKLRASTSLNQLYAFNEFASPGLLEKAKVYIGDTKNPDEVARIASECRPDFAIVGSEDPLARGAADALKAVGVPCVGPTKELAKLESSKSYTRELIAKHDIPGNPEFQVFRTFDGLPEYIRSKTDFVIKPDGLTGGKGVQVSGEHFTTEAEALNYCRELFAVGHPAIIIEEKLDGEEFSFQSFFDGRNIRHMIPVQDHKRLRDDDKGPNTGGMGSYTCSNHLLPFLSAEDVALAGDINQRVGDALRTETGEEYKGILYGGFMLTRNGLRVIEYNARFGDPEVMNVLSLLDTDFVAVCRAIIDGTLDRLSVSFRRQASVCKYLVPDGYPKKSPRSVGTEIDLSELKRSPLLGKKLHLYYSAVEGKGDLVRLTDSRALAVVGIGDDLDEAEAIAEEAASAVKGQVFHRKDIGTARLIKKRTDHMQKIRGSTPTRVRRFA